MNQINSNGMKRERIDNMLRGLLVAGNIVTVNRHGDKTALQTDGKVMATISKDSFNKGRHCGSFGAFGYCNNKRI